MRRPILAGVRVLALVAVISSHNAVAETPEICMDPAGQIDLHHDIDKDDIAGQALSDAGVTVMFVKRATARGMVASQAPDGITPWQELVVRGEALCNTKGAAPRAGEITCSDDERKAIAGAALKLFPKFSDPAFQLYDGASLATVKPQAIEFFRTDALQLRCVGQLGGPALTTSAGPGSGSAGQSSGKGTSEILAWKNFRVRGASGDLIYRTNSAGYDGADKAKLSIGKDSGKATTNLVGAVGYAIPLDHGSDDDTSAYVSMSLLPFVAVDLENSKKDGATRNTTSNVISFGTAFAYTYAYSDAEPDPAHPPSRDFLIDVGATPKVIFNHHDHSSIAGFNLLVHPSFWLINSERPIGGSNIQFSFLGDVRLDNGLFLRHGTRSDAASRNFSRIGARGGLLFTIIKDASLPIDLTFTDTWMQALTGEPGHLSQLATDLTVYFNKKKNFGVDLGYSRGRIEDLDEREHKWSLAFTAKY